MKKTFIITILIVFLLVFISIIFIRVNLNKKEQQSSEIKKYNLEYEQYTNRQVYGTDIATLIGKAIKQNEKNKVQKDGNGYYIENEEDSIKIDLKMVTINKTYPMEEIYNNEISEFVKNFNTIRFKCEEIEYHSETGKISKMVFEEQV
ncbi:MAG: hypothetical protein J5507_02285 [Clostridia bacterium]|nr:hypothetical protein [Clostridia bacterium]